MVTTKYPILFGSLLLSLSNSLTPHDSKTFLRQFSRIERPTLLKDSGYNRFSHLPLDLSSNAHIGVSFFINESNSSKDLGGYFGVDHEEKNVINFDARGTEEGTISLRNLIHSYEFDDSSLYDEDVKASAKLSPTVRSSGTIFSYHQQLDNFLPGLFFTASTAIERQERNPHLQTSGSITDEGLKHFLTGSLSQKELKKSTKYDTKFKNGTKLPHRPNHQQELMKARIEKDDVVGFADLSLAMGYHFVDREDFTLAGNGQLIVPTGNRPTGKKLFEAIIGNGGHHGLGVGANACWKPGYENGMGLSIDVGANMLYLFARDEERTLGMKKTDGSGNIEPLGHYQLLIKKSEAQAAIDAVNADYSDDSDVDDDEIDNQAHNKITYLIPAANVFTLPCSIKPGVGLNVSAQVSWMLQSLRLSGGYEFSYRQQEKVEFNGELEEEYCLANEGLHIQYPRISAGADEVTDTGDSTTDLSKYQLAEKNSFTITKAKLTAQATYFRPIATDGGNTRYIIKSEDLSTDPATAPSSNLHRLFGSISWESFETELPFRFCLTGHYDYAHGNASPSGWGGALNLGLKF